MRARVLMPLAAVIAFAAPTASDDKDPDAALVAALSAFFLQEDAEARAVQGLAIAARWPDARRVAAAIPRAKRWTEDEPGGDVVAWKRRTADGVAHTIYANVPEGYDPKRPWPVLIWLHGGVRRDADEAGLFGLRALSDASDEEGFILVCPSTQRGAAWWTPNGVDLVRGTLRDVAARWRIDGNRVAVAGFSDGGRGCWHLLLHDPDPYACFMPLMVPPAGLRRRLDASLARNVRSRPVLAVTGGKDRLFPSARAKPIIEELRKAGGDVEWLDLPEAEHLLSEAVPLAWERMSRFMKAHPRETLRAKVDWAIDSSGGEGRFDWVEILAPEDGLGSSRAEAHVAEGNRIHVAVFRVKRCRLHLAPGMKGLDLGRPLKVLVNGRTRFDGVVQGDVGYALTEAVRRGPGAPAYVASIVLEP